MTATDFHSTSAIGLHKFEPSTVSIMATDGRTLLAIHPDGRVEGAVEDANEAGSRFVEALRLFLAQATPTIQWGIDYGDDDDEPRQCSEEMARKRASKEFGDKIVYRRFYPSFAGAWTEEK